MHDIPKGRQNALTYISYMSLSCSRDNVTVQLVLTTDLRTAGGLEGSWNAHSSAAAAKNKRWPHQCFCMSKA